MSRYLGLFCGVALALLMAVAAPSLTAAQRNPGQFTAPGCGPNSRFESCSDGCVPTCNEASGRCTPSMECVEECICYRGYVRNPTGYGCIEPSACT